MEQQVRIAPFKKGLRLFAILTLLATLLVGIVPAVNVQAATQGGTSDIAIQPILNGNAYTSACFVLVGFSNVGCDDNADGIVTFRDVPLGVYTVRQTANLGSGLYINDFTIQVTGIPDWNGWEIFTTYVNGGGSSGGGGTSDVAIRTHLGVYSYYDACYVLVGYSNVGCDENRDGLVTFQDIPLGTYTLHQTRDLGVGCSIADTTIRVTGVPTAGGWEIFDVYAYAAGIANACQGGSSGGGSTGGTSSPVDISLITREPQNGRLLTDVCYVLVGYSNVGCDENADGQVTFAAIPPGVYTVRQTSTPAGYPAIADFNIEVRSILGGVPLGFLVRQAPNQNAPGTRNVSVVMVDSVTGQKIATGICAEIIGASNVGCDHDLIDGQIDFLDVPAGTYNLNISNLPAGYSVLPIGQVTIDASANAPTDQMIFVQVYVPR